jgi:broad specificity phosphatase PhoE
LCTIHLFRHGQAGTRENYDLLSELGREQSRLLGRYLAERAVAFDAVYAGGLNRQRQTADLTLAALRAGERSRGTAPEVIVDERWNEFSLLAVYQGLAPRLVADSAEFARDYEQMRLDLAADPHTTRGAAGRCDRAVIEAWMGNHYPDYEGQLWEEFRAVARGGFRDLSARDPKDNVAIFTSVTPIAVWVGAALELPNEKILRLMAALYNSSWTTLKIREGELLLLSFNATPHLLDPSLITFR